MMEDNKKNFKQDEENERKVKAEIKLLNLIEDVGMLIRKCVDPAQNVLLEGLQ